MKGRRWEGRAVLPIQPTKEWSRIIKIKSAEVSLYIIFVHFRPPLLLASADCPHAHSTTKYPQAELATQKKRKSMATARQVWVQPFLVGAVHICFMYIGDALTHK